MGTARAQHRRTHRQRVVRSIVGSRGGRGRSCGNAEERRNARGAVVHVVLAAVARVARQLALHLVGGMGATGVHEQRVFQHVIKLFQHEHLLEAFGKLRSQLLREGVGRAHLPEAVGGNLDAPLGCAGLHHAQRLARVRRRHAAGHDAEPRHRATFRHRVERRERRLGGEVVRDGRKPLVDFAVRLVSAAWEDDPLGIALEALVGHRACVGGVRDVEERRGVVDARGGTHDDGRVVALGQVERSLHHGEALIGRGGIEHGHLREAGETARVLLGLRRDRARIVGHEQHHAALDAHVVQAHERVGRHVEAHLLAGEQATRARVRRAGQQLERALLVRGPLHMDAARAPSPWSFATVSISSDDGVPGYPATTRTPASSAACANASLPISSFFVISRCPQPMQTDVSRETFLSHHDSKRGCTPKGASAKGML